MKAEATLHNGGGWAIYSPGNPKEYTQKNSQFRNSLPLTSSDDTQSKTFNCGVFCLCAAG